MSLKNYSHEEVEKMAMIDLSYLIMMEEKEAMHFRDIFDKAAEQKGYTEEQKQDLLVQFYTDLNMDGRFLTIGSNKWGLKRWYPVEQIDELVTTEPKKNKKKKKKKPAKKTADTTEEVDIDRKELDIVDEDIADLTKDLADEADEETYVGEYNSAYEDEEYEEDEEAADDEYDEDEEEEEV